MSLFQITSNQILRLADHSSEESTSKLIDELEALASVGFEGWLPDDLWSGAEALEEIFRRASKSQQASIERALVMLLRKWLACPSKFSVRAIASLFFIASRSSDRSQIAEVLVGISPDQIIELSLFDLSNARLGEISSTLVNCWIKVTCESSEAVKERDLLSAIQQSEKFSGSEKFAVWSAYCINSVRVGRSVTNEQAIAEWIYSASSRDKSELSKLAAADRRLRRCPNRNAVLVVFKQFFRILTDQALVASAVSDSLKLLAEYLEKELLYGNRADGTLSFLVHDVFGDRVLDFVAEADIAEAMHAQIMRRLNNVSSHQASELFKLASQGLLAALNEVHPEKFDEWRARYPFNDPSSKERKARDLSRFEMT
ncbi:hypothetical protein [Roseiconus lacunae]|uniref:hypothetical protein n=1 Tax=Roseiconus lacunae TaxID=2605694 RepID=UPI001E47D090|nr:hypothetical protein [Roseiconus lacunae]MCD0461404.1 hypothetical protein [Roseiconus lacunae]